MQSNWELTDTIRNKFIAILCLDLETQIILAGKMNSPSGPQVQICQPYVVMIVYEIPNCLLILVEWTTSFLDCSQYKCNTSEFHLLGPPRMSTHFVPPTCKLRQPTTILLRFHLLNHFQKFLYSFYLNSLHRRMQQPHSITT